MEREELLKEARGCAVFLGWAGAILLGAIGINMIAEWAGYEGGITEREYDRQLQMEMQDYERPRSITTTNTSNGRTSCDPAYPTVCIKPVSVVGDLDCDDIGHTSFTVRYPDPHWFDQDNDGIGCEPWDDQ